MVVLVVLMTSITTNTEQDIFGSFNSRIIHNDTKLGKIKRVTQQRCSAILASAKTSYTFSQ